MMSYPLFKRITQIATLSSGLFLSSLSFAGNSYEEYFVHFTNDNEFSGVEIGDVTIGSAGGDELNYHEDACGVRFIDVPGYGFGLGYGGGGPYDDVYDSASYIDVMLPLPGCGGGIDIEKDDGTPINLNGTSFYVQSWSIKYLDDNGEVIVSGGICIPCITMDSLYYNNGNKSREVLLPILFKQLKDDSAGKTPSGRAHIVQLKDSVLALSRGVQAAIAERRRNHLEKFERSVSQMEDKAMRALNSSASFAMKCYKEIGATNGDLPLSCSQAEREYEQSMELLKTIDQFLMD